MTKSSFFTSAVALARDGIPLFPCIPGGKAPAVAGGYRASTVDLDQIGRWWSDNPNYNIGVCPEFAGWLVIDLDVKGDGAANWERVTAELNCPQDTYTVRTPSGGRHLYFAGSGPTTASKLAPGIDTRGVGGYVLVPPSVVGGKAYQVERLAALANVPAELSAALASHAVPVSAPDVELDLPGNVARAVGHLDAAVVRGDVAIAGEGGNNRTYQMACEILNLGISPAMCRELLTLHWNGACRPPWEADELMTIVEHAASYAQNEPGAWAVPPAAEAFAEAVKKLAPARKSRFLTVAEMAALPDPIWLLKDVLMQGGTALLVGAWRSYKSFLALDIALAIATGKGSCFGEAPTQCGPVIYACLEGMTGIAKARRRAWCLAHDLEPDADMPFFLGAAPLLRDNVDCQAFLEDVQATMSTHCGGAKPALIVIDTLAQTMAGLDETRDAGQFIRLCHDLAGSTGAAVLVLHHFGHDKGKGARGGTVYPSGFDTYLEGEARGERRVEVWVRKQKDAEERAAPFVMQGRKIGGALAFFPIDRHEHNRAIAAADPFSWQSIGAALLALEAAGRDKAVSTAVLAQQVFPRRDGEDPAEYGARVAKAGRQIGALARNRLAAYCEQTARGTFWFMPITSSSPAEPGAASS